MTEVVLRSHSSSNHHFPSPPSSRFVGCPQSERDEGDQASLLEALVAAFRKSLVGCSVGGEEGPEMEIGSPTDVRHVAHVTFDRFDGFLGLPAEFEPHVPRTAPSASTTVFGVSTDSMQLSYDSRGNSVPTILLLMQKHLYAQRGLQAEGIFRINADNNQEEYVRDQLNKGIVPEGIDVHCLAGLIKAWFRELRTGILDSLSPVQVMQSESEEDCSQLVRLLPPMEAALLDWAINLMADVAQHEHWNKMNAHSVAVVFAPNMTKMAEPLTDLMYAVQVMNFLKTLIARTLRGRGDPVIKSLQPSSSLDPSDDIEPLSSSFCLLPQEADKETDREELHVSSKARAGDDVSPGTDPLGLTLVEKDEVSCRDNSKVAGTFPCKVVSRVNSEEEVREEVTSGYPNSGASSKCLKSWNGQSINVNIKRGSTRVASVEKGKGEGSANAGSHMNSWTEVGEAWR
ncbi:hypothetical protein MLD38_020315 [Melastoma candidum]|uniref:Uncharacterized protein n=1 Tax=Melastoma candidum TaxID=119954 RepID=A0ACB9QDG5_9MYRT|nr:hypothetical protein MLD38_020315 [Melastoma candidum]